MFNKLSTSIINNHFLVVYKNILKISVQELQLKYPVKQQAGLIIIKYTVPLTTSY